MTILITVEHVFKSESRSLTGENLYVVDDIGGCVDLKAYNEVLVFVELVACA